jgi:hypothetical protein
MTFGIPLTLAFELVSFVKLKFGIDAIRTQSGPEKWQCVLLTKSGPQFKHFPSI